MQGGCTCENASLLRVDTGNVEFAALFAPKPLGMTTANDWTKQMSDEGLSRAARAVRAARQAGQRHARPRRTVPAQLQRRLASRVLHMAQRALQTRPARSRNRKRLRAAPSRPANRLGQRSPGPQSHGPRLRAQASPVVHRRRRQTNPRSRRIARRVSQARRPRRRSPHRPHLRHRRRQSNGTSPKNTTAATTSK